MEVWVAEDSPFYRLVVEEAIEEISRVTCFPIELTVFERFGDICKAFDEAEKGNRHLPIAVLSDLHFPDNPNNDLHDILAFYSRYVHAVPVSYMSSNPASLKLAESLSGHSDVVQSPEFLRKDTTETMINLVKAIHAMVFTPRGRTFASHPTLA